VIDDVRFSCGSLSLVLLRLKAALPFLPRSLNSRKRDEFDELFLRPRNSLLLRLISISASKSNSSASDCVALYMNLCV
jgi:hypothetical protein